MTRITPSLLVSLVFLLVGCGKPSAPPVLPTPPPQQQPPPPAEEGYAGVPEVASPPQPAGPEPAALAAPKEVNLANDDAENRLVRQEVLKRIDVMPDLSDDEKDRLYVQVERARAMGKVITIPFASGERSLRGAASEALKEAVKLPQIEKFSIDPTVAFVVLGYADKRGDARANLEISRQRAEVVVKVLKEKAGVANIIHAVGMGSSEMFDSASLDKNRVVEVWVVLP